MSSRTFRLDIASVEQEIFSGEVSFVSVTGEMGEMGIAAGHVPLLTMLRPGPVFVTRENSSEEIFCVLSGILEVQPDVVTILADVAMRGSDIDETAACAAKEAAEKQLTGHTPSLDIAQANLHLSEAMAKMRVLKELHRLKSKK